MAEDDAPIAASGRSGRSAADAVAFTGASQAKADAYLEEQTLLAKLQSQNLLEQNAFELSHLRFRRFSDYARLALEIAGFLVVLLIVCGLGTMVWSASQDRDLVVEAFSVPPDMAQSGMTGSVLASRVLDRLGDMDRKIFSFTQDFSGIHGAEHEDVRVEIPDTGVSIGELNRYLRGWLGHETHVTGELVRANDMLSLTVRYGDEPGATVEGTPKDLDNLIQKTAENLFRVAHPLRFADYLSSNGRIEEAAKILEHETTRGSAEHRAEAFVSLGTNAFFRGDQEGLARAGEVATRLDPNNIVAWFLLTGGANNLSREEQLLRATEAAMPLAKSQAATATNNEFVKNVPLNLSANQEALRGDWAGVVKTCNEVIGSSPGICGGANLVGNYAEIHDIRNARMVADELPKTNSLGKPLVDILFARAQTEVAAGDIAGALIWSRKGDDVCANVPSRFWDCAVFLLPYEAEAMARAGNIAGAEAVVAKTPVDCDLCVRARGRVDMIAKNWSGAAYWFALVSARSPDVPFADADWGMMLLAKGDLAGAIAKFKSAQAKGPHFADPLEMWGEALTRENRSDLALAKFEEAAKYAPNWGRLHLKWGEALLWTGDKADAKKQFAIAANLDLSAAERARLSQVETPHG
jgi:tetratricopeptide (TPR) repeat protein